MLAWPEEKPTGWSWASALFPSSMAERLSSSSGRRMPAPAVTWMDGGLISPSGLSKTPRPFVYAGRCPFARTTSLISGEGTHLKSIFHKMARPNSRMSKTPLEYDIVVGRVYNLPATECYSPDALNSFPRFSDLVAPNL